MGIGSFVLALLGDECCCCGVWSVLFMLARFMSCCVFICGYVWCGITLSTNITKRMFLFDLYIERFVLGDTRCCWCGGGVWSVLFMLPASL